MGLKYSDTTTLVIVQIPPNYLLFHRRIVQNDLGRNMLCKKSNLKRIGFRALLCTQIEQWNGSAFVMYVSEALRRQGNEDLIPHLDKHKFRLEIPWTVSFLVYKPADIFHDFNFDDRTFVSPCPCNFSNRFFKYLDPSTAEAFTGSYDPV